MGTNEKTGCQSFKNLNIEKLKSIYNDLITKAKYKKNNEKKNNFLCSYILVNFLINISSFVLIQSVTKNIYTKEYIEFKKRFENLILKLYFLILFLVWDTGKL